MTIHLTGPAMEKFDPDPAIQEWLKDSKPKLMRSRVEIVELPVAGGKFMER